MGDMGDVQTERCPVCGGEPWDLTIAAWPDQGFCASTRCEVLMWNPRISLDANLTQVAMIGPVLGLD